MGWMASAVSRGSGVCSGREKEARMATWRAARGGRKGREAEVGAGQGLGQRAHLGFAAGLGAQSVRGAIELLGHHAQELCLVLAAVVVGGADAHELEGRSMGRKRQDGVEGTGWADTSTCQLCPDLAVPFRPIPGFPEDASGAKSESSPPPPPPRALGYSRPGPPTWLGWTWSLEEEG